MTRCFSMLAAIVVVVPLLAQQPAAPPAKADLEPLSKLIRDAVLKQVPKSFEDNSGWNLSKPIPAKIRLPGLPRTVIRVGDHDVRERLIGLGFRDRLSRDRAGDRRFNCRLEVADAEELAFDRTGGIGVADEYAG